MLFEIGMSDIDILVQCTHIIIVKENILIITVIDVAGS